jgi:hypothetical protein
LVRNVDCVREKGSNKSVQQTQTSQQKYSEHLDTTELLL